VGDRGILTSARIREELAETDGLDWITALRAPAIKKLAADGALELSLFDQRDLAEIQHPDFPNERLVVCRNPLLGAERARKREELLQATEQELEKIRQATRRPKRRLKGKDRIGVRTGRVLHRFKMGKHFQLEITEDNFSYRRKEEAIAAEAALDGLYVIRTSVPAEAMDADTCVASYKSLSAVERAFRSLKSVDLKIRPIHHRTADRVRSHVTECHGGPANAHPVAQRRVFTCHRVGSGHSFRSDAQRCSRDGGSEPGEQALRHKVTVPSRGHRDGGPVDL